jgi:hypothetical protein
MDASEKFSIIKSFKVLSIVDLKFLEKYSESLIIQCLIFIQKFSKKSHFIQLKYGNYTNQSSPKWNKKFFTITEKQFII